MLDSDTDLGFDPKTGEFILRTREACGEPWTSERYESFDAMVCACREFELSSITATDLKFGYGGFSNSMFSRDGYSYVTFLSENGGNFDVSVVQTNPDGTSNQAVAIPEGDINYPFTDNVHADPAIGVDSDGYIWLVEPLRLSDPVLWRSDSPHDISSFSEQSGLPDTYAGQYPYFICMPNGDLWLWMRTRTQTPNPQGFWAGVYSGTLWKYDGTAWNEVGSNSFPAISAAEQNNNPTLVGKTWDQGLGGAITPTSKRAFFEPYAINSRFWRYPIGHPQQGQLIEGSPASAATTVPNWAYNGYWIDTQVVGSRIYLSTVVSIEPTYLGTEPPTVTENVLGTNYIYDSEEYVLNYTIGRAAVVVYSDDNGNTWQAMDGSVLSYPFNVDQTGAAFTQANALVADRLRDAPVLFETQNGNIGLRVQSGDEVSFREFVNGSWTPYEVNSSKDFVGNIAGVNGSEFVFSADNNQSSLDAFDLTCGTLNGTLPTNSQNGVWGNASQVDKTAIKNGEVIISNANVSIGGDFQITTITQTQ